MSGEETRIYGAIIEEQIFLQKMQAMLIRLERGDGDESELSMVTRQIEDQRAVLSGLWEKARSLNADENYEKVGNYGLNGLDGPNGAVEVAP
jgi:hypothetical protein